MSDYDYDAGSYNDNDANEYVDDEYGGGDDYDYNNYDS